MGSPRGHNPGGASDAGGQPSAAGADEYLRALHAIWHRENVERIPPAQVDLPRVMRLDRMHALCKALGDPHFAVPVLHVAGSKGKGSVCEMLAAALRGCGCVVGQYTSPHMIDVRERIAIDGLCIDQPQFTALAARILDAERRLDASLGPVTAFEALTAMAFLHCASHAVDVMVVEVGVGGLLDATNVVRPLGTAITCIQLEHRDLLGPTLAHIAAHKAGIMKPGVPCITLPQQAEVHEVFVECARRVDCPLLTLGVDVDVSVHHEAHSKRGTHYRVSVRTPRGTYDNVPVPLPGEHQAWNCALALTLLDEVGGAERSPLRIDLAGIVKGLDVTRRMGRLEVVRDHPRVIVDGAHTPESVRAAVASLRGTLASECVIAVFGCASDKDAPAMLRALATKADKIFVTAASGSARAMTPRDLERAAHAAQLKTNVLPVPTVREALDRALRDMRPGDAILVIGSFALAGEAKALLIKPGPGGGSTQAPPSPPRRGV